MEVENGEETGKPGNRPAGMDGGGADGYGAFGGNSQRVGLYCDSPALYGGEHYGPDHGGEPDRDAFGAGPDGGGDFGMEKLSKANELNESMSITPQARDEYESKLWNIGGSN